MGGVGLPADLPILNTLDISCFASQKSFSMIYERPDKSFNPNDRNDELRITELLETSLGNINL